MACFMNTDWRRGPVAMSAIDGTLKLCNCNKTMALDARAVADALGLAAAPQLHSELCRQEIGAFHAALTDDACTVACTQEAPLFSAFAEEAGATRRGALRQHPRDRRLVARKPRHHPEDRGADRRGRVAGPRTRCRHHLPVGRPAAHRRSDGGRAGVGGASVFRRSRGHRARHRRAGRTARRPPLRGVVRHASRSSPAGSARSTSSGSRPIRSTSSAARAATPACAACPEHAIDFSLPDRHGQVHRPPRLREGLRRHRRDRFLADRHRTQRTLRPRARPLAPSRCSSVPHKPQGYFAPGRDPLDQSLAAAAVAQAGRRVREAEVLRVQREALRARAFGKTGCTKCIDVCSTQRDPLRGRQGRSRIRICARAAAAAPPCVPPAR